tara:strand:+ start:3826 stop:4173 length:348 start_codon:yes stop_codon:yes gene_type:complete
MGLIYPLAKGIRKAREPSNYDLPLKLYASWMNEGIEVIYPGEARKKEMEGSVILELEFEHDGKLSECTLTESSSHAILDKAAITAASKAALSEQAIETNAGFKQQLKVTFRLQNA